MAEVVELETPESKNGTKGDRERCLVELIAQRSD